MLQMAQKESASVAEAYLSRLADVLGTVPSAPVEKTVQLLLAARASGRRVYVIGNGGSAATASHFVCDLTKSARVTGFAPLRAFALSDNAAVMTAWANDTDFNRTYAEQIKALVEDGDVVIAISASGNSPNIVAALQSAAEQGAHTVALVGFDGGAAGVMADVTIHIPCRDYGLVEDTHSALGHAMTKAVRLALESEAA